MSWYCGAHAVPGYPNSTTRVRVAARPRMERASATLSGNRTLAGRGGRRVALAAAVLTLFVVCAEGAACSPAAALTALSLPAASAASGADASGIDSPAAALPSRGTPDRTPASPLPLVVLPATPQSQRRAPSARRALRPDSSQRTETLRRRGSRRSPRATLTLVDLREAPAQLTISLEEQVREPQYLQPGEGLLGARLSKQAVKRVLDVLTAAVALILLSPILLAAALIVKISSRGPVFYAQDRVGQDGQHFRFVKFRTMRDGAHDARPSLATQNQADGPVFKIRRDPRITRVGRVLRKLSVDELPQLVHVLSGKMSLVGPRPPLPEEVARYGAWERQRLLVKPGLTCSWQVNGRSDLDFATWVLMDIEYIRDWSLWLDVRLLVRTVPAVLSGRGAY
jgi:lipopolysaccharide/colanic/teichoic acid biosynthesis glycosyltransferase